MQPLADAHNAERVKYIKSALAMAGESQSSLARRLGISAKAVGQTVHGSRRCPKVLAFFAEIGVPQLYLAPPRRAGLRPLMQAHGVSIAALARAAGLSRQYVTDVVDGHRQHAGVTKALESLLQGV